VPVDVEITLDASAAHGRRIAALMRAFQRLLRRKPTTVERHAMRRAADLTARAEWAAADPSVPLNDVVRIDGAAHRARLAFMALAGVKRKPAPSLRFSRHVTADQT
jgi:hypothetical protein